MRSFFIITVQWQFYTVSVLNNSAMLGWTAPPAPSPPRCLPTVPAQESMIYLLQMISLYTGR